MECGEHFTGRPNKVYCSPKCRKRAENNRASMRKMLEPMPMLHERAEEARLAGNYHKMRLSMAQANRLRERLTELAEKYGIIEASLWIQQLREWLRKAP